MGNFRKNGGDKGGDSRPNFQHKKAHTNNFKNRNSQNQHQKKFDNNRPAPNQQSSGAAPRDFSKKKDFNPNQNKQNFRNDNKLSGRPQEGGRQNQKPRGGNFKNNNSRNGNQSAGGFNKNKNFQKSNYSQGNKGHNESSDSAQQNQKPREKDGTPRGIKRYQDKKNRQKNPQSSSQTNESTEVKINYVVHPSKLQKLKENVKNQNMSRREQKQKEYKDAKYKKMTILNQKTSKGQPLMKGRMKLLYEKIQKNFDRENKA